MLKWRLSGEAVKYQALLDQMKEVRGYMLESVRGLSETQVLTVPEGFRNNILWNLGHAITDNCTMQYPPTGHAFPLPEEYLRWFAPGTSPADWTETPVLEDVLRAGAQMRDKLVEDCTAGRMEQFTPMPLGDGVVLENIAYAIAHSNIHEGVHLGVILALRKLV